MNPNTPVNDTSGWLAFNNSFSEALAWATEKLSQPFAAPNIPSAGVEDRNDAPAAASGDGANASADAGKTEKQRLAEQHEAEAYEILSSLIKTYFTDIPLNPFQTIAALHLYQSLQKQSEEALDPPTPDPNDASPQVPEAGSKSGGLIQTELRNMGVEQDMDPDRLYQAGRGRMIEPSLAELETLQHFLHFSTATYGWQYAGVWANRMKPMDLLGARDSRELNKSAVAALTGIDPAKDLLFYQFESEIYRPAHLMAVDHRTKSVVLAIRGSFAMKDALTDVVAQYVEFSAYPGHVGMAHSGMLRCAQWVVADLAGALELALGQFRGYEAVLVGHSLGAGVATIGGLLLKGRIPGLRVYAFAAPCSLDLATATDPWCASHITSVVNNRDVVCRLSIGSLDDLKSILCRLAERNSILQRMFRWPLGSPDAAAEADRAWREDISLPDHGVPKLYMGGRLVHFVTSRRAWSLMSLQGLFAPPTHTLFERGQLHFDRICLHGDFMHDHFPDQYEKVLGALVDKKRKHLEVTQNPI